MNRRGFLQSCLALAAAPAIVRADSLMRIVPRDTTILTPAMLDLSGNGRHLFMFHNRIIVFKENETVIYGQQSPVAWYRA